jgi:hypothetical protein
MMRRFVIAASLALVIVLSMAAVVSAKALTFTDHTPPPDEMFVDINPCTGSPHTVSLSFKKAVFHVTTDNTGGFHVTGTVNATASTDDGFAGRFTGWFGANEPSGGSDIFEATDTFAATMHGPGSQTLLVKGVVHITIDVSTFTVRSFVDNFTLTCVGKP